MDLGYFLVCGGEEEVGKVGVAFNQSGKQKGTSSRFLIKHFTSFRI